LVVWNRHMGGSAWLAENVRIPSYGGGGLQLLKKKSYIMIFERFLNGFD